MTHPPEPELPASYSLEIVAEITGISSQSILIYQEHGLIRPADETGNFDDEAVHTLRRIEHLRSAAETNLAGLKLILDLLDEVDRLKLALRSRH